MESIRHAEYTRGISRKAGRILRRTPMGRMSSASAGDIERKHTEVGVGHQPWLLTLRGSTRMWGAGHQPSAGDISKEGRVK